MIGEMFVDNGWPNDPLGLDSSGLEDKPLWNEVFDDLLIGFEKEAIGLDPLGPGSDLLSFNSMCQRSMMDDGLQGFGEPIDYGISDDLMVEPGGLADIDPGNVAGLGGSGPEALADIRAENLTLLADGNPDRVLHQREFFREPTGVLQYYDSLFEEHRFIEEHECWREDAGLNEMLDNVEETIEASEERPFFPSGLEEERLHPDTRVSTRLATPSGQSPPLPKEAGRSPPVEPPVRMWRPRGGGRPRRGSLRFKTSARWPKARSVHWFTDCPSVRQRVSDEECRECEYQNLEKWLENPGEEDPCSHPGYWAYLGERIFGSEGSEKED